MSNLQRQASAGLLPSRRQTRELAQPLVAQTLAPLREAEEPVARVYTSAVHCERLKAAGVGRVDRDDA